MKYEVYVQVPQDRETPIQNGKDRFTYRYTYARAMESKLAHEKGQDYLTFRHDEQSFCFVLCDGVSLSFFGDLAARILGDSLLDWLSSSFLNKQQDNDLLQQRLSSYLQDLTAKATTHIRSFAIPSHIPEIVSEVLEDKRNFGSETTYICGRVDLPSKTFPEGRLLLSWMGDSRLRVWDHEVEKTDLIRFYPKTEQRWSTVRGPVEGRPNVVSMSLQNLTHLQIYTDGISELDSLEYVPDDQELETYIQLANSKATSDDLALLDLSWTKRK